MSSPPKRWQKMTLGVLYLVGCVYLCGKGLAGGSDPAALGIMCGGIATGIIGVAFANVQEQKHRQGQGSREA